MPSLLTSACPQRTDQPGSERAGGGATLEEVLDSAWRRLDAGLAVACAVCGGRMDPEPGAAGRCRDCGTTLT
jgi:hypothetical protein